MKTDLIAGMDTFGKKKDETQNARNCIKKGLNTEDVEKYYTDFPIESLDAFKMFICPSEGRAGAAGDMRDLAEFDHVSEQ